MELIIDIPEERFRDIQRIAEVQLESNHFKTAEQIVANGIPLPKGHGRLIDADDIALIDEQFYVSSDYYVAESAIDDAPTIIEADKAESEGAE